MTAEIHPPPRSIIFSQRGSSQLPAGDAWPTAFASVPFALVGPDVVLDEGVVLPHSHVVVDGRTRIGAGTRVLSVASLGTAPQDLKYHGEPSELVNRRATP